MVRADIGEIRKSTSVISLGAATAAAAEAKPGAESGAKSAKTNSIINDAAAGTVDKLRWLRQQMHTLIENGFTSQQLEDCTLKRTLYTAFDGMELKEVPPLINAYATCLSCLSVSSETGIIAPFRFSQG